MTSIKKKILIIHPSMEIGGAERALIGLLNTFDYKKYDVDLLLYGHHGDFMPLIPTEVNLLPYNDKYDIFDSSILNLLKKFKIFPAIFRLYARKLEKFHSKKKGIPHSVWHAQQLIHKNIIKFIPNVKGEYNLAINFLGIPSVLVKRVKAKVKLTWIHTDYSKIVADHDLDLELFNKIDKIINVSEDCKRIFENFYPELRSKSIVIENILNQRLIQKLANESETPEFENNNIKLLSIGRFGDAKNFESIPLIAKHITKISNIKFTWYIIGYGKGESIILENIKKYDVKDKVIILGKRTNPYPYIKNCDMYIQPSRFEGKAVTVREAQMLLKPVVITNYPTAHSQVKHGYDGIIVPMENEACANGIADFINKKDLQNQIIQNLRKSDFSNSQEITKIYSLIP